MLNFTYIHNVDELHSFNENSFNKFDYVAVFHLEESIPPREYRSMRASISRWMGEHSVLILDKDTVAKSNNKWINEFFDGFSNIPANSVGIHTALVGINDALLFTQHIEKITPSPIGRYPYLNGLNNALLALENKLNETELSQFKLPGFYSRSAKSRITNGALIAKIRVNKGTFRSIAANSEVSRGTLQNMERYGPVELDSIRLFAEYCEVGYEDLVVSNIGLNKEYFKALMSETNMDKPSLASKFGLASPRFFDVLEHSSGPIPEHIIRYVYYEFSRLIKDLFPTRNELLIKDFLDTDNIVTLAQQAS